MEKFVEVIKIIMEKHLISSVISIAGAIVTYLLFPQDNWIILKLGTPLFILLLFSCYFLLVKLLVYTVHCVKSLIEDTYYKIKDKEEDKYNTIQKINDFYDSLPPQDKKILLTFVKNRNKTLVSFDQLIHCDSKLLKRKDLIDVTDYTEEIKTLDQKCYWISPVLEKQIQSQTYPEIGLKQYRIKDDFFQELEWVYKSKGKLGNF